MSDPVELVGRKLPLGVRVAGAVALVAGLAAALAWPILQAEGGTATRAAGDEPAGADGSSPQTQTIEFGPEAVVQQGGAEVVPASTIRVPGVALDRESEIASGTIGDKRWSLVLAAGDELWCFTFRVEPGPENQGVSCSQVGVGPPAGIPVTFTPSGLSEGLGRGIVVAALHTDTRELTLRATNDEPVRAALIQPPTFFAGPPVMLLAFLPPRTDIVEANATDSSGEAIAVDPLVDLTDQY